MIDHHLILDVIIKLEQDTVSIVNLVVEKNIVVQVVAFVYKYKERKIGIRKMDNFLYYDIKRLAKEIRH